MIDDDRAALAAAQDFSAGIAMWRAANTARNVSDFTTCRRFGRLSTMPLTLAAILTLVNCVLLGFALLPASASL